MWRGARVTGDEHPDLSPRPGHAIFRCPARSEAGRRGRRWSGETARRQPTRNRARRHRRGNAHPHPGEVGLRRRGVAPGVRRDHGSRTAGADRESTITRPSMDARATNVSTPRHRVQTWLSRGRTARLPRVAHDSQRWRQHGAARCRRRHRARPPRRRDRRAPLDRRRRRGGRRWRAGHCPPREDKPGGRDAAATGRSRRSGPPRAPAPEGSHGHPP